MFENISRLCEEKGISIARLEKECGLGNATVRRWGTSFPNVGSLKRVADYFGITVDELLADESNNGT